MQNAEQQPRPLVIRGNGLKSGDIGYDLACQYCPIFAQ